MKMRKHGSTPATHPIFVEFRIKILISSERVSLAKESQPCPVRLMVRTVDFHSANRGSIPLQGTSYLKERLS